MMDVEMKGERDEDDKDNGFRFKYGYVCWWVGGGVYGFGSRFRFSILHHMIVSR